MTATLVPQSATEQPSRERVELIISQLDRLPTLPAVVTRLLAVTTSPRSSAPDVVAVIESDASLTAAVLRMTRRADLGIRDDTMTVARAVTLLGFNNVRNAVLSLQFYQSFSGGGGVPTDDLRPELWRHNIAVACLAEMLAESTKGEIDPGEAFVCGMLHDIGKVALCACLPKSYARAVETSRRRRIGICDAEREVFGFDHTVAGRRVATRWQLPQPIVECVWLHHQPPDALPSTVVSSHLLGLVHLANILARGTSIGASDYTHAFDTVSLEQSLGLPDGATASAVGRLPARVEPILGWIGLSDRSEDLTESLLEANKHLGEVNARLARKNRDLDMRARCFDAVERLWDRLGTAGDIADVCAAAADSFRGLLEAREAIGFFSPPGNDTVYAAISRPGMIDIRASLVDLGDLCDWRSTFSGKNRSSHALFDAGDKAETIWRRVSGRQAAEPIWALPIEVAGECWGAALAVASEPSARPFLSEFEACGVLTTAIAMALESARARDDAHRINDELLDLNRRLREAQEQTVQVRSIGMIAAMAAGAAHEMNNPLAVISGRAQLELARRDDPELRQTFGTIIEHAQRTADIVTDLMRFAKPEPPSPISQSLAQVLEPLCQHWRSHFEEKNGQIRCTLEDPNATIYADPMQLREILDALMANAIEATDPDSAVILVNSPSRQSDETVRIVVEDNGVGMSRDVMAHAFDPFYSSRPAGRGRGLGLSRAYRFAEINGGRLWLDSIPGQTTIVTLELPTRPPKP